MRATGLESKSDAELAAAAEAIYVRSHLGDRAIQDLARIVAELARRLHNRTSAT